MRNRVMLSFIILVWVGGIAWWARAPLATAWRSLGIGGSPITASHAKPGPETYRVLTQDLERWRKQLATRYHAASTAKVREAVENDARVILELALPEMMRCWLGTPWDFHGTAKAPGAGKIACGYFVSTLLKDAGFQLDRYQLAQQPSENILRSFLKKSSCSLSVGENYADFTAGLKGRESGIYIVGLDTHVAFIIIRPDGFRFIHSSGSKPWCVVDESSADASVLRRSRWRMIGNLTADPTVLKKWLKAEKIHVRGA